MSDRIDEMDAEHRVQVGLIQALDDAVRAGRRGDKVREILAQLTEYSNAHFMSEQLLMRLHAYPEYEDHVRDHERMTDALAALGTATEQGDGTPTLEQIDRLRAILVDHIRGRDALFDQFVSAGRGADTGRPSG